MAKEKTKKEHYVPRCYLKRWGNENDQVCVFDKKKKRNWINNYYDVACERFFYDINSSELNKDALNFLHNHGIFPEEDEQFIENFFSKQVETEYGVLLKDLVDKEITPWYEKNCFFISEQKKIMFSICLAYQFIRTKTARQTISDTALCLEKWMNDMDCSSELKERYLLPKGEENIIQSNMFFDFNHITHIAETFFGLSWILRINKTDKDFFTSDNPIGTYPHVRKYGMSMSGIASEGVEVYIPLSPKHLLVMYDGKYHTEIKKHDRRFCAIDNVEDVDWYNRLSVHNSGQYIYSNQTGVDDIKKIVSEDREMIDLPKVSMSYGGKTYTP